jgi:K(+)-stimulated pyrophosphate-energized sodium pump
LRLFWCSFLGFAEYGNENSNKTNVRTTQAARTSLPQALKFLWWWNRMGLGVAGLAVLGLTLSLSFLPFLYEWHMDFNRGHDHRLETLAFSWSRINRLVSVGGGIYTKAADELI